MNKQKLRMSGGGHECKGWSWCSPSESPAHARLMLPLVPHMPSSSYHCPALETQEEPEEAEVKVGMEEHI